MAFSSNCLFVLVALLLQCFIESSSALTSTKYIDKLCQMPSINNKTFCLQKLSGYPPAASATGLFPLAEVVIRGIVVPHAQKSASFANVASKKLPNLKTQFKTCQDAYITIVSSLLSATKGLKESPETANYDVMVCSDQTTQVKTLVGKNKDMASKRLIRMTFYMEKLLRLAIGATEVVGG